MTSSVPERIMLFARAEPMQPPAPVIRTVLPCFAAPSGFTRSRVLLWMAAGECKKYAVVHNHRTREDGCGARAGNSDARRAAAERRASGLCVRRGCVTGLHGDSRGLGRAV